VVAIRGRSLGSYTAAEFNATFGGGRPSTRDDVPRTNDGEPLDTIDKVKAFIEQLAADRAKRETAADQNVNDNGL
jgi:hypothetical protein